MNREILFVFDNYHPKVGGAELVYQRLAEGLATRGWHVTVVTTGAKELASREKVNGVEVQRLCRNRYLFLFLAFFYLIFSKSKSSIVHTATYSSAIPSWLYARLTSKKIVITVHEVLGPIWFRGMNFFAGAVHWFFERLVFLFRYDKYVAVSEYSKKTLHEFRSIQDRIVVVTNGIDKIEASSLDRQEACEKFSLRFDASIFLYFGRLGISKGVDTLIAACSNFLVEYRDAMMVWVVAAAESKALSRELESLRARFPAQVIFLQPLARDELIDLIAGVDYVVVPSLSEGFGFSALESISLDKPVIASDIEIFRETLWGKLLFFKAGDSSELVCAMQKALAGEFEIKSKSKDFSWDNMIEQYIQIYDSLT